jgi:hypothetical protein
VKPVQIEEEDMLDLSLGRSIYSKAQVEEFLKFQDSKGTWRAYLMETAELAYGGKARMGPGAWGWGSELGRPSSMRWAGPWCPSTF